MANRSFYELLEKQIREDLREDLKAEIRQEFEKELGFSMNRMSRASHSNSTAEPLGPATASERVQTWLTSKISRTVFKRPQQARTAYSQPLAGAGPSTRKDAETHSSTQASAQNLDQDLNQESAQAPTAAPAAELRVQAETSEEIFALELIRRHSGHDLGTKGTGFTETELKAAWRRAALKTHPDRYAQSDQISLVRANALFRELSAAYDRLLAAFEQKAA